MTRNTPSKSRPSMKMAKPKARGVFGVSSQFAGIGRAAIDGDSRFAPTGLRTAPAPVSRPGGGGGGRVPLPSPPGGPGGGVDELDVLTYGATVTPDADLAGFKTLAAVNATASSFTLEKATGDAANFIIEVINSGGTIDLTLGTGVKQIRAHGVAIDWNNEDGATNLISCQWDGTTMRVMIRPGVDSVSPTVLAPANAVTFDGSNDWLELNAGLTGLVNGKVGLVSFWIYPRNLAASAYIIRGSESTSFFNSFQVRIDSGGIFIRGFTNNTTTITLNATANPGSLTLFKWNHVLLAWDLATATVQMYIDDVDELGVVTTADDNEIDYEMDDWTICALEDNQSNGGKYNGDIAEVYCNLAETLDLDTESNRRLFIDLNRQPVPLGATGEIPTGSDPNIFLSGATGSWHTNLGTGGGFTENGAITDAPTSP